MDDLIQSISVLQLVLFGCSAAVVVCLALDTLWL